MQTFLLISLISFAITMILAVPFIGVLYRLKFRNPAYKSEDIFGKKTIFQELHGHKKGTPTGAGILIVAATLLLSLVFYMIYFGKLSAELNIILLAGLMFGILGFIDDMQKFFKMERTGIFGLRIRQKFLLQLLFSLVLGYLLYSTAGLSSITIPMFGTLELGAGYVFFAALLITYISNAFNIADGLDGLSGGLLVIVLIPVWIIAASAGNNSVLTATAVLTGSLLGFLYFNVSPARFFMGDTGALGLGAILATVILVTRAEAALIIAAGVIVIEGASSLIQWGSLYFRHKRVFKIAPLHHHFEAIGWNETKVVERFWIAAVVCAIAGLLIYSL